jgi:hypothetical protein
MRKKNLYVKIVCNKKPRNWQFRGRDQLNSDVKSIFLRWPKRELIFVYQERIFQLS